MKAFTKQNGFTIMEMIVVIVIVGILAGLAIPNISRVSYMTDFDAASGDLNMLVAAQKQYYAMYQHYYPRTPQPVDWLNTQVALNIQITTDTVNYNCSDTSDDDTYSCSAVRIASPQFTINISETTTPANLEAIAPLSCVDTTCTADASGG